MFEAEKMWRWFSPFFWDTQMIRFPGPRCPEISLGEIVEQLWVQVLLLVSYPDQENVWSYQYHELIALPDIA